MYGRRSGRIPEKTAGRCSSFLGHTLHQKRGGLITRLYDYCGKIKNDQAADMSAGGRNGSEVQVFGRKTNNKQIILETDRHIGKIILKLKQVVRMLGGFI
jgi:hypothetical protein